MTLVKANLASLGANGEPWLIQFYSADASTAAELMAAVTGTQHYIRTIDITYAIGTTAKYWVLVNDNEAEITERVDSIDYNPHNYRKYIVPLPCGVGHAIRLLAESSGDISAKIEGFSRQERLRSDNVIGGSASTSASVSTTPSASVSSTPSTSLSVSASPSISSSPSATTSASPSLSPSASISSSASISASISASPSVSASVS